MNFDATDTQFTESAIEAVREGDDFYELTHDGWMILCPKVNGLPAPKVGETLRLYGRGIGFTVRGIVVGSPLAWRTYRYMTEAEEAAQHEQRRQDEETARERKFEETREETDRRIAALPEPFRRRIYRFQDDGGHTFRRDYESYELFCCEQAVAIADALKNRHELRAWRELSFAEQKARVPALDDGHSGNTFGTACHLAALWMGDPELVVLTHGALTPLVGCEAYGCKHPNEAAAPHPAQGDETAR